MLDYPLGGDEARLDGRGGTSVYHLDIPLDKRQDLVTLVRFLSRAPLMRLCLHCISIVLANRFYTVVV